MLPGCPTRARRLLPLRAPIRRGCRVCALSNAWSPVTPFLRSVPPRRKLKRIAGAIVRALVLAISGPEPSADQPYIEAVLATQGRHRKILLLLSHR